MRREFCALLLALTTACAPDVHIGEERRLAVMTAVPAAEGRWREAGTRTALRRPGDEVIAAPGWFGRAEADGSLPTITSLETTPSAVSSSTMLGATWVIAGSLGDEGFVRALDENDGQVWETRLGAEVRSISTTNEGSLVVAGNAPGGGFVALLEASGAVRWERHFEIDFQRTASGFVPVAIVADPGAPSPSRRQFWVTGTRARASDTPAYALQMTFDGELWDSEPFAATGVARGVAAFDVGVAICVAVDGAVQLAWTQGGAVSGAALTEVRLEEPFELAGCLAGPNEVELFGTFARGAPAVVAVDRATRLARDARQYSEPSPITVLGGARGADGRVTTFGLQLEPVRRWRAAMPP